MIFIPSELYRFEKNSGIVIAPKRCVIFRVIRPNTSQASAPPARALNRPTHRPPNPQSQPYCPANPMKTTAEK